MQSLTISSRGKGIEGKTVVIHFISSLWRKGEEEWAEEALQRAVRTAAAGMTQLRVWG